ncbi:MAG: DUF59 domain-containing protein [Dehalococcoidia bacterium]|nr:DUF59 domain-containing protein [Dehalococcoidia bacterium]
MADSISTQQVQQALKEVRHPEINNTLSNLGMLGDVSITGNRVTVTLMLPVLEIPAQVRDHLTNTLSQALVALNADLQAEFNLVEMGQEKRAKFLAMAREGWLG